MFVDGVDHHRTNSDLLRCTDHPPKRIAEESRADSLALPISIDS